MLHRRVLSAILSFVVILLTAQAYGASTSTQIKDCQQCHDPEISHPIKMMLGSKHWSKSIAESPVNNKGCQSCHGASVTHASTPTKIQPLISFGPRWTSSVDQQNDICLTCHEKTTTHKQWRDGKHAEQDVTCVTCHDLHQDTDPIRVAKTQASVCTVCHKVQKSGMHHLSNKIADNPPCSTCHNPHANPLPTVMMLKNRSEGCRSCHDFSRMQKDIAVTDKAKSYHRVMQSDDRTCVDCHQGVAHVDKDNFGKLLAGGLTSAVIHLFFPGQSDGDWLLEEHKGAQALRQGRNCRQCHIGDAKNMANRLTPKGITPTIKGNVAVKKVNDKMELTVKWQGTANDNSVAIMFDNGLVDDFGRQGCWAACHSDLPGMTRDREQGLKKYLLIAQKQRKSVGTPSILHDKTTLSEMRKKGQFVELWRATLDQGKFDSVSRYSILDERKEAAVGDLSARGSFNNGTWTVTFSKPINDRSKPILSDKSVTFGIAIHGDGESAAKHRVSLPMTVSFDGTDTDFVLK